jgi:hypothetical protein
MAVTINGSSPRAITPALNAKTTTAQIYSLTLSTVRYGFPLRGVSGTTYVFTLGNSSHATTFTLYAANGDRITSFTTSSGTYSHVAAADFARVYAQTANAGSTFTMTTVNISTDTIGVLDIITTAGNYAACGGTAGNYISGQYAHYVVVGASGGGGGGATNNPNTNPNGGQQGGFGGYGNAVASNAAFALTGSYTFTLGAGGNGGAGRGYGYSQNGLPGNAGGTTNAFGQTLTGGNGGAGGITGTGNQSNSFGTAGTPSTAYSLTEPIFGTATPNVTGRGLRGNNGVNQNCSSGGGGAGQSGAVFVLRWTP